MLVKILGILDLISGLVLIFGLYKFLPNFFIILLGVLVLLKSSLGMFKDFAGWIDFFAGVILFLTISGQVPWFACFIGGILVLQKAVVSFI